jgi:hypothetical protein
MRTTEPTKLASLRRAAAVITFTRNNNKQIQARNSRQASTQGVTTQPSCVAVFKQPLFLAFTIALAILAFAATPAMAEFGLERLAISARNQNGTPDVQAGSHPYALNTTFLLHDAGPAAGQGDLRDVRVELPPGFVGDPTATPRCTYQEFLKEHLVNGLKISECSGETQVGLATTYLSSSGIGPDERAATTEPIYNIVPPPGVAAEFGYIVKSTTPVLLETSVRTGGDYGLTTTVSDINQGVVVGASKVTIWGVPANPAHNPWRGGCEYKTGGEATPVETPGYGLREGEDELEGPLYREGVGNPNLKGLGLPFSIGECKTSVPEAPLLTNPTSCGTPRAATLSVDDWEEPGNFATEPGNLAGEKVHKLSASLPELSGCEQLDFSPTLEVKPDGEAGSTPTGLNVGLHVPQEATVNPTGLAEADVKNTTVTLPAGMQLSPSAADGLQACSNAQIGFEGYRELDSSGTQSMIFKPKKTRCVPMRRRSRRSRSRRRCWKANWKARCTSPRRRTSRACRKTRSARSSRCIWSLKKRNAVSRSSSRGRSRRTR